MGGFDADGFYELHVCVLCCFFPLLFAGIILGGILWNRRQERLAERDNVTIPGPGPYWSEREAGSDEPSTGIQPTQQVSEQAPPQDEDNSAR